MANKKAAKQKALLIKSRSSNGFWRCGMKFTPEGVHITEQVVEDKGWGEEQIKTLTSDPDLIAKEVEIDTAEDGATE